HAANKRDELAPSHVPSQAENTPYQRDPDCASQQIRVADVRFGSKADISECPSDVRFTPKSRHWNSAA
ncbi:MAG TPA: hypothetical protein VM910_23435, partial [Bradyrhizobium sp.]|nr:hypothetical protein [Bradyrhizobium sp.]